MKNIRLFTLVWGERYIDWFAKACTASLCWPKNSEAIQAHSVGWDILTREEDATRVREIASALGIPVNIRIKTDTEEAVGVTLQKAFLEQMRLCVERNESMLLCPPDTVFGDGCVSAMIAMGDVCVAVAHARVLPNLLDDMIGPVANAELVTLAWKHLHRSWREADISKEMANSNVGGVAWREISPGVYAVQHRLPTCYLASFNADDITWFEGQVFVGAWDHLWPAKLVAEQRQRVLASSDAAFLVELTNEFENIPAVAAIDPAEPDKYWGQQLHHWCNRNVVSIFRAA